MFLCFHVKFKHESTKTCMFPCKLLSLIFFWGGGRGGISLLFQKANHLEEFAMYTMYQAHQYIQLIRWQVCCVHVECLDQVKDGSGESSLSVFSHQV